MTHRRVTFIACIGLVQILATEFAVAADNFEAGLSAWTTDGAVRSFEQAGNHLAALEEPGAGSRSRLYRADIAVPTTPTHLSFRYYFSYAPRVRDTAVPPDSFSAYFIDASGNRLVVPSGTGETSFSDAGGGENVVTVPSFPGWRRKRGDCP